jgi:hypothetical protein
MQDSPTTAREFQSPLIAPASSKPRKLSPVDIFRLYARKLPSVFRSALGHILLELPRNWSVGPAFQEESDQSFSQNKRTLARALGIQELWAKYPWMDQADLEIFLRGFDAGEQWGLRKQGTEEHTATYSQK